MKFIVKFITFKVRVDADSEEEAKTEALKLMGDTEFTVDDIQSVEKTTPSSTKMVHIF